MSTTTESAASPPFTQTRDFWVLIIYAVVLGVIGAFAGLLFVGATVGGGKWYVDSNPHWFGGHWWWIAVTAAAGVVVGLLRRLIRLQTAPILIAVITAFLTMEGVKYLVATRKKARAAAARQPASLSGHGAEG